MMDTNEGGAGLAPPSQPQDEFSSASPLFTSAAITAGDFSANPTVTTRPSFNAVFNLNDDELEKLDSALKQKLVENGENFIQQYDNLRITHERLKAEYEQRFVELESDYNECKDKLAAELESSYLHRTKANEFDERVMQLTRQVKKLESEKEIYISNEQKLNAVNLNLEAEKRELLNLLDKRIKENDRLNEEWKSMNLKLSESESIICELTSQNDEIKSKETSLTIREKHFESDKERMLNEISWLNQQLKEKSTQVIELKSQLNQTSSELETKLELSSSEVKKLQSQLDSLQKLNESLQSQLEDRSAQLQELRERETRARLEYNDEAASREKLIELYKEEARENKERLDEATRMIAETNELLVECRSEYGRVLDEKASGDAAYEARIKCKDENIAKLEQELKNANELLSIAKRKGATVLSESDIEQLSPAAAVASRLLKSGMTLTQIYSEYVNLSETLQYEKSENERLKAYLQELVSDIEEKAPIFNRQKIEYEDAMKTIANLSAQLENSMMDYEVLKSKSEDSIKKYNMVTSENGRLKQDVNDLSRQVSVLLYEIEKQRARRLNPRGAAGSVGEHLDTTLAHLFGNNPNESMMMNETNVAEVTSSSEMLGGASGAGVASSGSMINKSAFVFRNIEDLQRQNQKLLQLVNEMNDKKQSEEKAELEMRTKEFNEKLNLAMRELEEFKVQREKQENILEEIRKQRDMYKNLLFQHQASKQNQSNLLGSPSTTSTPAIGLRMMKTTTTTPGDLDVITSTTTATSDHQHYNELLAEQSKQNEQIRAQLQQKLDETKASLDRLHGQFDKYKEEMLTQNRMLNEEVDTYRASSSDATMKLALAESKLESALEKCKTMASVLEKTRKELDAAKEKISTLNGVIIKHESALALANNELAQARERANASDTRLHSMALENDLHKSNYERLSKEFEIVQRENASRSNILSNLEMIRAGMERNEREAKLMYTQRIEQLEKDNQIMRKQLEHDKEQHAVVVKSWQSQYDQLVGQRDSEKADYEKTRNDLSEIKASYDQLQTKFTEVEAKLHTNELMLQMGRNSKSTTTAITHLNQLEEESKELKSKLSAAEKEIVNLKIQLEDSRTHLKQYKHIAEMTEKNVRETNEAHAQEKALLESRANELSEQLRRVQSEYEETQAARERVEQEVATLRVELDERTAQFAQERADLSGKIEHSKKQIENIEMILNERTQSRDDFAAKVSVLDEQLRTSSQRLLELEHEMEARNNELNEMRGTLAARELDLDLEKKARAETVANYEANERMWNENLDKLKAENETLIGQNNLLQQELSKLGEQLIILRNEDTFERAAAAQQQASGDQQQQSTSISNLLEINSYLRREKEKLEESSTSLSLKLEISQQRQKALESDVELQKKSVQMYERQIEQLKQKLETTTTTTTSTVSGSMAMSNELMLDENKRLRDEVESLTADNTKLGDEVRKLEDEIANLKGSLRMSELKFETLSGSADCLKIEIEKWKGRLDALMRDSQYGEEWTKMQTEMSEIREQIAQLSTANADLNKALSEKTSALEQTSYELNVLREQNALDKQTHQREIETLRNEKRNREEMFRGLVSGLKEVVIGVQKELELKDFDWSMKGATGSDRTKVIKDELEVIKKTITEKLKSVKETMREKSQKFDEILAEKETAVKKAEEIEGKINEKDTKIGQLTNFTNQMRLKAQSQLKSIEDLKKQLEESRTQITQLQQQNESLNTSGSSSQTHNKQEFDALKMRFLQSQVENEKLKKELESTTSRMNASQTQPSTSASSSILSTPVQASSTSITTTTPTPTATTSVQQTVVTASSSSTNTTTTTNTPTASSTPTVGQQSSQTVTNESVQQPPTAYIAPSRITKVMPSQQSAVQSTQQQGGPLSLRRTAAVQPTLHETISTQPQQQQQQNPTTPTTSMVQPQRQQLVTPLNVSSVSSVPSSTSLAETPTQSQQQQPTQWSQNQQTSEQAEEQPSARGSSNTTTVAATKPPAVATATPTTAITLPSTSSSMLAKRTREDESSENLEATSVDQANSKKQRNNFEQDLSEQQNFQQEQSSNIGVETFNDPNEQPDYIVINEETQENEGQEEVELEESPEEDDDDNDGSDVQDDNDQEDNEIVLDDDPVTNIILSKLT